MVETAQCLRALDDGLVCPVSAPVLDDGTERMGVGCPVSVLVLDDGAGRMGVGCPVSFLVLDDGCPCSLEGWSLLSGVRARPR